MRRDWRWCTGSRIAPNQAPALELDAMFGAGINLVLTDVVTARLGGPELVRRSSTRAPGRKVLFTSSCSASAVSENARAPLEGFRP
jgi:hypothetical protein